MNGRFGYHDGYGHHRLGLLLLLVGVVALAALTSYLVVSLSRRSRHAATPAPPTAAFAGADRALDTARVRYAQGEIDRDTYLRIVNDLTGASAVAPPTP